MNQNNPVRLFVGHCWDESDDYLRFFDYVSDIDSFFYINLSEPQKRPGAGVEAVQTELNRQMKDAEAVIIFSSAYTEDANLTQYQMDLARALGKPIIGVEPFGPQTVMKAVKDRAAEVVPWYNRAMVDAIMHHGRGDSTSRYEVIDFP
ncbi:MAG: hypothetical protein HKN70_07625 [Gammaproteobacteria bacterium]|nr:hypothetical protein [Gammaproteobacteria bacterium]